MIPKSAKNNKSLLRRILGSRWMCLFSAMACFAMNVGQIRTVGIYYPVFVRVFNANKREISTVFSICYFLFAATGLISSFLNHHLGPRRTVFLCSLLASSGLVLASMCRTLPQMIMAYCIVGIGCGGASVPCHSTLAHRFPEHTAFGFAMIQVGVSMGVTILSPLTHILIDIFGWRGSLLINAALILNLTLIAVLLTFDAHNQHQQIISKQSSPLQQLTTWTGPNSVWVPHPLWLPLIFAMVGFGYGTQCVYDQTVNSFAITRGINEHHSPYLQTVGAAVDSIGRLSIGITYALLPTLNPLNVALPALTVCFIGMLAVTVCHQFWHFICAISLALAGWSAFCSSYAAINKQVFGLEKFPLVQGMSHAGGAFGGLIVPILAGWMSDTYSFSIGFKVAALSASISLFCACLLRTRLWWTKDTHKYANPV